MPSLAKFCTSCLSNILLVHQKRWLPLDRFLWTIRFCFFTSPRVGVRFIYQLSLGYWVFHLFYYKVDWRLSEWRSGGFWHKNWLEKVKETAHKRCISFIPDTLVYQAMKFFNLQLLFFFLHSGGTDVLLVLQRMDLGECPKIHDLALRADYEQASKKRDYYYDIDVRVPSFYSPFILL